MMPQPTMALPISLFNYGYDVYIDGNRGTKYNIITSATKEVDDKGEKKEVPLEREDEEYWQFDFRQMALED